AGAVIEYDRDRLTEERVLDAIAALSYGPNTELVAASIVPAVKERAPLRWLRKILYLIDCLFPAAVQLAIGAAAFVLPVLRVPALVSRLCLIASAAPIACRAARALVEEKKIGIDALDGMAASVMIASGRLVEAGFMTVLIGLGELIREKTSKRCEALVSNL